MINHLLSPGNSYILAGDLNKIYDSKGKGLNLKKWADDLGLRNPVCEYNICNNIGLYTRYTGTTGTSHVDHIMNRPECIIPVAYGCSSSSQWAAMTMSDHRPLWVSYSLVGGVFEKYRKTKKKQRTARTNTKLW